MRNPPSGWRQLVQEAVQRLPVSFSLSDLFEQRDFFATHYPANRFIDAKIRQSLQILRDQGTIRFLGNGKYARLDITPKFSPLLAPHLAEGLANPAQIARVILETWAEMNMYCLNCRADSLHRLAANTPVADFSCDSCDARYQLKGKNGRFGHHLLGAAYEPTVRAARAGKMPEYLLVEFDARYATVIFVDAVPGRQITEDRIRSRTPLKSTARRAGWQGCIIDVSSLSRVRLVEPQGLERDAVRASWSTIPD